MARNACHACLISTVRGPCKKCVGRYVASIRHIRKLNLYSLDIDGGIPIPLAKIVWGKVYPQLNRNDNPVNSTHFKNKVF